MNMSSFKTVAVAAALAGAAALAQAQELKVGYVNSEIVLRDANPAKAAQARLQAEFGKREKELAEQGMEDYEKRLTTEDTQ